MALPIMKTDDTAMMLMQTAWASQLNPVILSPLHPGTILKSVVLASGDNTIEHKLGRTLQGWFIVRQRASASIYDKQDSNVIPTRTLILNASAAVTVDIYVF